MPKRVRYDSNKAMITVLHGDDIITSRKKLTYLKEQFKDGEVLQFEGGKTNVTDVVQVFESASLFAKKRLIVLERFLETKDRTLIASILNHLKKSTHEVVFWEPKEIKRELLTLFPKQANIFFFKQEQALFQFLDSIKTGNARYSLPLLHQVLKKESEELVFYMVVRQFRLLLSIASKAAISEIKRLAPWQRSKLERQARQFTSDRLLLFYRKLFQIEREVKTGGNALPLSASLDLFLTDI